MRLVRFGQVEGGRVIRVTFDGGTADTMPWRFRPTQGDVKVSHAQLGRLVESVFFTEEASLRIEQGAVEKIQKTHVISSPLVCPRTFFGDTVAVLQFWCFPQIERRA